MATYTDTIRRWATDDRRVGMLPDADGTGEVGLGDGEVGLRLAVRFTLLLSNERVAAVRYQVFGCGFTIAACAATAELAEGHSLAEISSIEPAWVDAVLGGLPEERRYCADLAVAALQAAIASVRNIHAPITTNIIVDDDHTSRITGADPVYRLLLDSPAPPGAPSDDRHLFACLLAVAVHETADVAAALGLSGDELGDLLHLYFPAVTTDHLRLCCPPAGKPLPQSNVDIGELLLGYLPQDTNGWLSVPSLWLARGLAARAVHPGHLWRAMGLFARTELTAAIQRHLPALAAANSKGMRWKRFLFKQLCERNGGILCKTPDCGTCSDYALCFGKT
jgi:nitrogen fixation protein NifQ